MGIIIEQEAEFAKGNIYTVAKHLASPCRLIVPGEWHLLCGCPVILSAKMPVLNKPLCGAGKN